MSHDARSAERIRRLQLMGIAVWQDRERIQSIADTDAAEPIVVASLDDKAARPPSSRPPPVPSMATANAPVSTIDWRTLDWQQLRAAAAGSACGQCGSRYDAVLGSGNASARIMIIDEAGGSDGTHRGAAADGQAGRLFGAMLQAIGVQTADVFFAQMLDCAQSGADAEAASTCRALVDRQIALVQPDLLITLGRLATQQLLKTKKSLGRLRGQIHQYGDAQIPLVATYHPAYLLRSPAQKRKAWEDLLMSQTIIASSTTEPAS
ncbi:MAG: uracil-DNA glycosylase [Pseudomonadota bacterium]